MDVWELFLMEDQLFVVDIKVITNISKIVMSLEGKFLHLEKWYFSSLVVTNKTFQLVRSIFSFHVEMFFLLGEPKAILSNNKNIKTEML